MATKKSTTKRSNQTSRPTKTVEDVSREVLDAAPEDENTKKVRAIRKERALSESAELTVEKVTQSLTKAGLDISQTLNSVRGLFESEIASLETIKEAIIAKTEELEELFGKEVVAASLRDLGLQYAARKAEWEKNMSETRENWTKEQRDHAALIAARDDELKKTRVREQDDYEYNKSIARRNDDEAWKMARAQREREQRETEEALDKTWREREEILKKAEAEVKANKDKLDNFDTNVQKEVDKHVSIIGNKLKSDFETKSKISQLEFESEKKLLQQENANLKGQIASLNVEIAKLRAALDKKDFEVKEVAVAALNAQSGQKALAAVQETVQSQSGNNKR